MPSTVRKQRNERNSKPPDGMGTASPVPRFFGTLTVGCNQTGRVGELIEINVTTQEIELKALMLASLDGDAASHRALLDRLSRRLRAYYKGKLARIGRGSAEAEDLVQEAVLAIQLKRHTYDPVEPLTPWVHAIARYKLIRFGETTERPAAPA
jgi:hypothetical protein